MSTAFRLALAFGTAAFLTACSDTSSPVEVSPSPARAFAYAGNGQHVLPGALTTDTLIVQVADAAGAPLSGVAVTWAADDAGTLLEPTSRTDANGRAQAIFASGTRVATARVTATVSGIEPTVFEVIIDPAAASQLQAMAPLSDTLDVGETYAGGGVKVMDQFGNAVPGVEFSAQLMDADESLVTLGFGGSDSNGIVHVPFVVAPSAAGSYALRFEASTLRLQYGLTVLAPVDSTSASSKR